jgi:hypothetical protein
VAVAQISAAVAKVSGDAQMGTVGAQLAGAIEVEVRDSRGNPVPGGRPNTTVDFAAGQGGSVTVATIQADASGRATTMWTLGTGAGAQDLTASIAGGGISTEFAATAGAGAADTIALESGDAQSGQIGVALADSLVVRVVDQFGNPVAGHMVTFAVTSGGGSVSPTMVATGADGLAATEWTLGGTVGTQNAEAQAATALTGSPVAFTATATNPIAASVEVFEGDGQFGLVGFDVNVAPAVLVRDQANDPFAGATVTFMVETGGGSLTLGTAISDADGVARVGSWEIGGAPGANTMSATVTGGAITGNPVTFTVTGEAAGYDVELRYQAGTTPTAAQEAAFDNAAAFWQTIIFRDQVDVPLNVDASACGIGTLMETVDDIVIFVRFAAIDGAGGVLAQAGTCDLPPPGLRSSNNLPVLGVMTMDNADLAGLEANGRLEAVVRHEMGHALGFAGGAQGLFTIKGFLQNPSLPGSPGVDTHFNGPQAITAMDAVGGADYAGGAKVPVENNAVSGQADSHWRESVFDAELMTPIIENVGTPNPFSRVTAAAMLDLGYGVNLAGAEAFALAAPPLGARLARVRQSLANDVLNYVLPPDAVRGRGR